MDEFSGDNDRMRGARREEVKRSVAADLFEGESPFVAPAELVTMKTCLVVATRRLKRGQNQPDCALFPRCTDVPLRRRLLHSSPNC